MQATRSKRFAICLKNEDCEDLVLGKVYLVLPDAEAEREKYLRVVDESGEDYLYPDPYFFFIELPTKVKRALGRKSPVAV